MGTAPFRKATQQQRRAALLDTVLSTSHAGLCLTNTKADLTPLSSGQTQKVKNKSQGDIKHTEEINDLVSHSLVPPKRLI